MTITNLSMNPVSFEGLQLVVQNGKNNPFVLKDFSGLSGSVTDASQTGGVWLNHSYNLSVDLTGQWGDADYIALYLTSTSDTLTDAQKASLIQRTKVILETPPPGVGTQGGTAARADSRSGDSPLASTAAGDSWSPAHRSPSSHRRADPGATTAPRSAASAEEPVGRPAGPVADSSADSASPAPSSAPSDGVEPTAPEQNPSPSPALPVPVIVLLVVLGLGGLGGILWLLISRRRRH